MTFDVVTLLVAMVFTNILGNLIFGWIAQFLGWGDDGDDR